MQNYKFTNDDDIFCKHEGQKKKEKMQRKKENGKKV